MNQVDFSPYNRRGSVKEEKDEVGDILLSAPAVEEQRSIDNLRRAISAFMVSSYTLSSFNMNTIAWQTTAKN